MRGGGAAAPQPARRSGAREGDRHLRVRPPPLRRPRAEHAGRRHPRPRVHGRGDGGGIGGREPAPRRPRGGPLRHLLRPLLLLPARPVGSVRQLQPQRRPRRRPARLLLRGALRLLPPDGRIRGRPGGAGARALRGRGPPQAAGGDLRRAGPVPLRHLPHRLHGGGELRHPSRRRDRHLGVRARGTVRPPQRAPPGRRARDRHRP